MACRTNDKEGGILNAKSIIDSPVWKDWALLITPSQAPKLAPVVVPALRGSQGAQKPGGPAVVDQGPSCLWLGATVVLWEVLEDHRRDPLGPEVDRQVSQPGDLQDQYVLLLYHMGSEVSVDVPVALTVSISHQSSDGFVLHSLASCCLKGLHNFLISLLLIDCR